jgi:hypothetical protein
MDAKDHGEQSVDKNNICRLEWIAWAMEAARRHKETEKLQPPSGSARGESDYMDDDE